MHEFPINWDISTMVPTLYCLHFCFRDIYQSPPISNTLVSWLLKGLGLWLFALLAPAMYAQFSVHAMFLFTQMNEATLCY